MSDWADYRIYEPVNRSYCYVCNINDSIHCYLALYKDGVFFKFDPGRQRDLPIEVTHFVQLPDSPYPFGIDGDKLTKVRETGWKKDGQN